LSYEANVEPSLAKLQARLGLSEAQLQKVVVATPPLLGYSYEANVEPKLAFMEAEMDLPLNELRDKICRFPPLLGYSLTKRYQPRLDVCRIMGHDCSVVIGRVAMPDARFYPSIGLPDWERWLMERICDD